MSEYSDSYHLHTADVGEVRRLLRRAGRYAMILGDTGPFVAFVTEPEPGTDAVVAANQGLLIRYDFSEDHGISLIAFEGAEASGSVELGPRTAPRDVDRFAQTLVRNGVIDEAGRGALVALAAQVPPDGLGPGRSAELSATVGRLLALVGLRRLQVSAGHLQALGRTALAQQFPGATFVNAAKKGKGPAPQPNEWCREPGMPAFMYLALPDAARLSARQRQQAARHLDYWRTTRDWNDDAQEGFWLYSAYKQQLPARYAFLPDRLMNLKDEDAQRRTIEAILAVVPDDVDWDAVLAQPSPAPVRL